MATYATVQDVIDLWKPLTTAEEDKANSLIPIAESSLKAECARAGKDLDEMVDNAPYLADVVKAIIVRAVASEINTPAGGGDVTQFSQSAMGYSVSGMYANPGGGIYFKKAELKRLGISTQKWGAINVY